jgi:hypothetical protein
MPLTDSPMKAPCQTNVKVHTYTELRQQIHDDLRIQHPDWVEPNGESSMRLMEELDILTRRGSNESSVAPHRHLNGELEGKDLWNMS